jgi:hypothetical protein
MEQSGTFLVTHAEEHSAVLRNVESGQVHALASNPGIDDGDVVEGTVGSDPPLEVTWKLVDVAERRSIALERSDEAPTSQEREIAMDQAVGEITRIPRAGTGELHVLTVPAGNSETATEDVLTDEETLARAARLSVDRVEVRSDDEAGVLSVRYLP